MLSQSLLDAIIRETKRRLPLFRLSVHIYV